MGAKTWMLVYGEGDIAKILRNKPQLDRSATDALVKQLFPKEKLVAIDDGDLCYTNPPDNEIYAGCFDGVCFIAAKEFAGDNPSQIDPRFIEAAKGKTVYSHAMHSVVDWMAFSKWQDGRIVRSLSLAPDFGVIEDIGERFSFEQPYWDGRHPAIDPEDVDEFDYPFPFHPLDLGEEVLKQFFGYQLEGYVDDSLIDPVDIPLMGYRRSNPWWRFW